MSIKNSKDGFHSVSPPLQKKYDRRTKKWYVVDKTDFVIANDMTKDNADVVEQSVNLIGNSVALLKILLEQEYILKYKKETTDKQILTREAIIKKIITFLQEDIGLKQEPQDYTRNLQEWGENLLYNSPKEEIELHEED